jgi:DNA modification methylase
MKLKKMKRVCVDNFSIWKSYSWQYLSESTHRNQTAYLLEQFSGFLAAVDVALKQWFGVRILWVKLAGRLAQRAV